MSNILFCELCNFSTNRNATWLIHIESEKHKRGGQKKSTNCDLCNYEAKLYWNVKIHKLYKHSTKEEREKCKYYCKECDTVLLCKSYYDKHNNSITHKNQILVNKSILI